MEDIGQSIEFLDIPCASTAYSEVWIKTPSASFNGFIMHEPIGRKDCPIGKQQIHPVLGYLSCVVKSFTLFSSFFAKNNSDWLSAAELTDHVKGCTLNSRKSQKVIYQSFYEYAMTICKRYTPNHEEAIEILNDGFLKIFKEIAHYQPAYTDVVASFRGWLRKIMIYTAIDHYRRNRKHQVVTYLDNVSLAVPALNEDALEKLIHKEIIRAAQTLSPAYQIAFNLFVIGGLTHEEIAKKMEISVGTSKSNLSKAKKQLRKILFKQNSFSIEMAT